jgi:hypothetical protein
MADIYGMVQARRGRRQRASQSMATARPMFSKLTSSPELLSLWGSSRQSLRHMREFPARSHEPPYFTNRVLLMRVARCFSYGALPPIPSDSHFEPKVTSWSSPCLMAVMTQPPRGGSRHSGKEWEPNHVELTGQRGCHPPQSSPAKISTRSSIS